MSQQTELTATIDLYEKLITNTQAKIQRYQGKLQILGDDLALLQDAKANLLLPISKK